MKPIKKGCQALATFFVFFSHFNQFIAHGCEDRMFSHAIAQPCCPCYSLSFLKWRNGLGYVLTFWALQKTQTQAREQTSCWFTAKPIGKWHARNQTCPPIYHSSGMFNLWRETVYVLNNRLSLSRINAPNFLPRVLWWLRFASSGWQHHIFPLKTQCATADRACLLLGCA